MFEKLHMQQKTVPQQGTNAKEGTCDSSESFGHVHGGITILLV